MVHLSSVQSPAQDSFPAIPQLKNLRIEPLEEHEYSESVYGSKYATEGLPALEMPEEEMPKDIAYRLIKDHLTLDGNPTLNLASFVSTYMEEEAEKLMAEALAKNFIDYEEYPQTADIQNRCVNMVASLYHAPMAEGEGENAMGTSTVGSSEAIMLATLAMKRRWQNKQRPRARTSRSQTLS